MEFKFVLNNGDDFVENLIPYTSSKFSRGILCTNSNIKNATIILYTIGNFVAQDRTKSLYKSVDWLVSIARRLGEKNKANRYTSIKINDAIIALAALFLNNCNISCNKTNK